MGLGDDVPTGTLTWGIARDMMVVFSYINVVVFASVAYSSPSNSSTSKKEFHIFDEVSNFIKISGLPTCNNMPVFLGLS